MAGAGLAAAVMAAVWFADRADDDLQPQIPATGSSPGVAGGNTRVPILSWHRRGAVPGLADASSADAKARDGGTRDARAWDDLEMTWRGEHSDDDWTTNIRGYLWAMFPSESIEVLDGVTLDCRETLCRVEVPGSLVGHFLGHHADLANPGLPHAHRFVHPDAGGGLVLFISREAHAEEYFGTTTVWNVVDAQVPLMQDPGDARPTAVVSRNDGATSEYYYEDE